MRAFPTALPPETLLVGGAARDLWLGRPPKDFDWAVPQPELTAQALAQTLGGSAFPLDSELGYWRITLSDGVQHDLVPLPADPLADLQRRDFTINALALDGRGQWLDPTSGQVDLRARRIRMISEQNLWDDPLRLWRGVRFSVTLGFKIEPQTQRAMKVIGQALQVAQLPMPAAERIRDEVQTLLRHPEAAQGVLKLEEYGLLALTLPELREGLGIKQGGYHHLDVFHHGLEALHQLLARCPDASLALRWATLLHDIGKPRTLKLDPDSGHASFHGHQTVGAELAGEALSRLRLPEREIKHSYALIAAHMLPLPSDQREARRFVHRRRELLPDLLHLMLADREAARGPLSTPSTRHAYALGFERILEALEEQPQPTPALLNGQEIMALCGLRPGPAVGELVRALQEAVALGDVRSREEAESFVQAYKFSSPSEPWSQ